MDKSSHTPDRTAQAPAGELSAESVRAQLARLSASRTLGNAPVLRRFLEHIVERTLIGKAEDLKEYALGTDVFDRGTQFDPRVDTIVRVQARRLRSKLQEHYRTDGRADPVVIELPKGHYVPTFRPASGIVEPPADAEPRRARGSWAAIGVGVVIGAALMTIAVSITAWRGGSRDTSVAVATAPADVRPDETAAVHVVVMPFENRTADASLNAFGQQVAERIIARLADVPNVLVGAPPAGLPVSKRPADAAMIITGTYYAHGPQLDLQARIVDGKTSRLLHGVVPVTASRDQLAEGIRRLEQRIAGAVAAHLDEFFGGLDIISQPPTLDAYRDYRAGLEIFQSDYARALTHLARARAAAPQFLPPAAVMYFALSNLGRLEAAEALLEEMEEQVDRLTAEERLFVEFLRAEWDGRSTEALRVLEDLERRAPESLVVNFNLVRQSLITNQPRAAIAAYDRRGVDARVFRHSIGIYRHLQMIQAMHVLGAYDKELEHSLLAQQHAPGTLVLLQAEARALVALERLPDVRQLIDRSQSMAATSGWMATPGQVMEHVALELRAHGHRDEALAQARRAVDWHLTRAGGVDPEQSLREGLARALYVAERWHEAAELFAALAREHPSNILYKGAVGRSAARVGNIALARRIEEELRRPVLPHDRAQASYIRACIAAILGERRQAVDLLREAFTLGLHHGIHIHNNPDLESLTGDASFLDLVRPAG